MAPYAIFLVVLRSYRYKSTPVPLGMKQSEDCAVTMYCLSYKQATMEPQTAPAPAATGTTIDRQLVDRILYLASLASRKNDIDSMMDILREVTAHWHDPEPLLPQDHAALEQLESKLKHYLVTADPLRTFTHESLEARLARQAKGGSPERRNLIAVLLISVTTGALAFLAPLPLSSRLLLCVPLFFVALHIGIAWFYLTALRNFNQDVRWAFIYISAGIVMLSLAFSHYVILSLLNIESYPILRYGGITWLFSIPFMLIFMGLRVYARLLQISSRLLTSWLAPTIALVAAGLLWFAPHSAVPNDFYFHIWSIGAAMISIFALPSSVLAYKIQKAATAAYAQPMRWLYYYTLAVGLGSVAAVGAVFWLGELYGGPLAVVTAACGTVPQLVLLYTGYSFKKETGK